MQVERAEPCKTTRRPSRCASRAHRLYAQGQGHWPWSKGSYDHMNAVRRVNGEIVAPTFPPQREPWDDRG